MIDLAYGSAVSLAAAIRSKQVSCREVIEAHLEHIERVNPPLDAIVRVLAEPARQQAREADEALARGAGVGPFHGVPMTIKDAWELKGVPSTGGTLGRANYIPEQDATVIARMRPQEPPTLRRCAHEDWPAGVVLHPSVRRAGRRVRGRTASGLYSRSSTVPT